MASPLQKYLQPAFNALAKFMDTNRIRPFIPIDPATGEPIDLTTGGGGGGQVDSIVPGDGILVDNTEPANPEVSVENPTPLDPGNPNRELVTNQLGETYLSDYELDDDAIVSGLDVEINDPGPGQVTLPAGTVRISGELFNVPAIVATIDFVATTVPVYGIRKSDLAFVNLGKNPSQAQKANEHNHLQQIQIQQVSPLSEDYH